MKSLCRQAFMVLALLLGVNAFAAPYPTEDQLRAAIEVAAKVAAPEGMPLKILDARPAGVKLTLTAAGLDLVDGVCLVFYNPEPEAALKNFFDGIREKDLPVWLDAIAVHEVTHCIEQREAYIRHQFDKVLPPDITTEGMTVQGYFGIVKSGAVEVWAEALADIAAVVYLKRAVPDRWSEIARGIMTMRRDLAGKWPTHDTSPWLDRIIAEQRDDPPPGVSCFEAAFQLRRQLSPR